MKFTTTAAIVLAASPALAIPPSSFGFPEASNNTQLYAAFRQSSGNAGYITVSPGELFGVDIPERRPVLGLNTSSTAGYNGSYLALMVDPDASTPENPTSRFILHWMQTNMSATTNLTINANLTLTGLHLENRTDSLVSYNRPRPPVNSSAHRYILYAFRQPANFAIPAAWSGISDNNRTRFNLTSFIRDTNLGTPAAANYFYVSNQTGVPGNFTASAGGSYPGGNGTAVTSGTATSSASATASASSSAASSATSHAGAAMVTGLSGILGAGLIGLAALM